MFKGVGGTVYLKAWDNDNQIWKTGYQASITARGCGDGTEFTPAGSVSQVDATYFPGLYKITLTDAENNYDVNAVGGSAADSTITIHGMEWINLPIDFNTTQKTSLNAATPASVGTVTGNVNGSVDSVTDAVTILSNSDITAILEDTGTTLDTLIKDIPTTAEFELRTLPSADYTVVSDTIAAVTMVNGIATDAITAASLKADAVAEIIAALKARIVDGAITGEKLDKLLLAFTSGKITIDASTSTFTFYDQSGVAILAMPFTITGVVRVIS